MQYFNLLQYLLQYLYILQKLLQSNHIGAIPVNIPLGRITKFACNADKISYAVMLQKDDTLYDDQKVLPSKSSQKRISLSLMFSIRMRNLPHINNLQPKKKQREQPVIQSTNPKIIPPKIKNKVPETLINSLKRIMLPQNLFFCNS